MILIGLLVEWKFHSKTSEVGTNVGAVEKTRIVKTSPKGLLYSAGLRGFIKERKDQAGTIGTYMWPDGYIDT